MILTTIAGSMVSLAALVLTITMVVVQLAMGQFSPRIVQRILRDKPSQLAIGLFVATFVHSILAVREVVNNGDGTGQVPGISLLTAFLLVLVSIAVLVIYVHHIGQALRVSALIELVGKETRKLLDRKYPDAGPALEPEPGAPAVVAARKSGVVTKIGSEELVEEARRVDCVLELVPALGEFVPAGAPLFRVHGDPADLDEDRLHAALMLALEPTLDEDVAYGIRLLVDIAERSLADSPFQDPTTAVQAVDRLHDLLRQLARRPIPDGLPSRRRGRGSACRVRDELGRVRPSRLRRDPPRRRRLATGDPPAQGRAHRSQVDWRLPDRVAVLEEQLDLLAAATETAMNDERDAEMALARRPRGNRRGRGARRALTRSGPALVGQELGGHDLEHAEVDDLHARRSRELVAHRTA